MMTKNDLDNFIDVMSKAIYEAGEMALEYQGKVKNFRKETWAMRLFGQVAAGCRGLCLALAPFMEWFCHV